MCIPVSLPSRSWASGRVELNRQWRRASSPVGEGKRGMNDKSPARGLHLAQKKPETRAPPPPGRAGAAPFSGGRLNGGSNLPSRPSYRPPEVRRQVTRHSASRRHRPRTVRRFAAQESAGSPCAARRPSTVQCPCKDRAPLSLVFSSLIRSLARVES